MLSAVMYENRILQLKDSERTPNVTKKIFFFILFNQLTSTQLLFILQLLQFHNFDHIAHSKPHSVTVLIMR